MNGWVKMIGAIGAFVAWQEFERWRAAARGAGGGAIRAGDVVKFDLADGPGGPRRVAATVVERLENGLLFVRAGRTAWMVDEREVWR